MATHGNTPAPSADTPALAVLCNILGILCIGVAIIGGAIVGSNSTTLAGWIVFGGWAIGALALFIIEVDPERETAGTGWLVMDRTGKVNTGDGV